MLLVQRPTGQGSVQPGRALGRTVDLTTALAGAGPATTTTELGADSDVTSQLMEKDGLSPNGGRLRRALLSRLGIPALAMTVLASALIAEQPIWQQMLVVGLLVLAGLLGGMIQLGPMAVDAAVQAIDDVLDGDSDGQVEERRALQDRIESWANDYPKTVEILQRVAVPLAVALIAAAATVAAAIFT